MRWAEIQVETTAQAQDAVGNVMLENGCGGVAIEGEAPVLVKCYLPVDERLEQRILQIQAGVAALPGFGLEIGSGGITVAYAEEQDWAEAWKRFFHTTRVGKRIVIKPTWEDYKPEPDDLVLEIDPGTAFGTGTHATTRLCLQALEKYVKRGAVVVDFGTGSGVLALAAARLGASLVIAFDSDETAVRVARANVQQNELEEAIEVHCTDSPAFINVPVDLITANLVAETIIAFSESLAALLKTGGVLIASGIISERLPEAEQSLCNAGFHMVESLGEGEWLALVARKA
ncbi:MAG TPA: 50S ribosomal protein L11 methyltransferase [Armatimonadota bacterium]|nr:50S ribosomal protein L11 methyltransferase [Armatimonadota bacterium]